MKHPHLIAALFAALMTSGTLCFAPSASAELRVVDGNLWKASSTAEKRAYLVGVANTVAVARALNARHGVSSPKGAIDRIDAALDGGTIDRAVETIDAWYDANPSRDGAPVLGVIWMNMVEPK